MAYEFCQIQFTANQWLTSETQTRPGNVISRFNKWHKVRPPSTHPRPGYGQFFPFSIQCDLKFNPRIKKNSIKNNKKKKRCPRIDQFNHFFFCSSSSSSSCVLVPIYFLIMYFFFLLKLYFFLLFLFLSYRPILLTLNRIRIDWIFGWIQGNYAPFAIPRWLKRNNFNWWNPTRLMRLFYEILQANTRLLLQQSSNRKLSKIDPVQLIITLENDWF